MTPSSSCPTSSSTYLKSPSACCPTWKSSFSFAIIEVSNICASIPIIICMHDKHTRQFPFIIPVEISRVTLARNVLTVNYQDLAASCDLYTHFFSFHNVPLGHSASFGELEICLSISLPYRNIAFMSIDLHLHTFEAIIDINNCFLTSSYESAFIFFISSNTLAASLTFHHLWSFQCIST